MVWAVPQFECSSKHSRLQLRRICSSLSCPLQERFAFDLNIATKKTCYYIRAIRVLSSIWKTCERFSENRQGCPRTRTKQIENSMYIEYYYKKFNCKSGVSHNYWKQFYFIYSGRTILLKVSLERIEVLLRQSSNTIYGIYWVVSNIAISVGLFALG